MSSAGYDIRKAGATTDHEAMAAIHAACFPAQPWSAESFTGLMSSPYSMAWLCAQPEKMSAAAGMILARRIEEEAEILTLGVHPDYRRRGIARTLLHTLLHTLRDQGCHTLHLEVESDNAAAIRLYESLDFTRTGIRKQYYRGTGRSPADALTMRRDV